jgi:hypothetical protein
MIMEALGMLCVAIFPIILIPVAVILLGVGSTLFGVKEKKQGQSLVRILAGCILVGGLSLLCYATLGFLLP